MDTRKNKGIVLSLCSVLSVLSFSSCMNDEYDIKKLDTTVTIGGENLTIPVGETEKMTFKELISSVDQDMIHSLEDGSYGIRMNDKMNLANDIPDLSKSLVVNDVVCPIHLKFSSDELIGDKIPSVPSIPGVPSVPQETITIDEISFNMDKENQFTLLSAGQLPENLLSVKTALLDDVKAEFNLSVKNLPAIGDGVIPELDLYIQFPSEIMLGDDPRIKGNQLHIVGKLINNKVNIDPVSIVGLDFSKFDFSAKKDLVTEIRLKGFLKALNPTINIKDFTDKEILIDVDINLKGIKFSKIEAKADYKLEPVNQNISLNDLPEFMKDDQFVLDFTRPYLKINAVTNLGIPIVGSLKLTPVYDGVEDLHSQVVLKDVVFPYTKDHSKPEEAHFFIASENVKCPDNYIPLVGDLSKLIRKIPDNLTITFEAGTDTRLDCTIEPAVKYDLNLDYEFIVPLEFGKDLKMEVADTISNLPAIVGDVLETGTLKLKGEVVSSLPVQLDMQVELLSADKTILPLEQKASQIIKACNADGSEVVSPLDLTLVAKKGMDLSNLDAFKLTFFITSGNASGIPISDKSFVQAKLKLNVPGGITIDLDEKSK